MFEVLLIYLVSSVLCLLAELNRMPAAGFQGTATITVEEEEEEEGGGGGETRRMRNE